MATCFLSFVEVIADGFFAPLASANFRTVSEARKQLLSVLGMAKRYSLFLLHTVFRIEINTDNAFCSLGVNNMGTPLPLFPRITIRLNFFVSSFSIFDKDEAISSCGASMGEFK